MPEPIPPRTLDMLALALVPGLGPRLTAALLRHFGSPAAVRLAGAEHLRQVPHIGETLAAQFASALRHSDVQGEVELIQRHDVHLRALGEPGYPPALARIPDPPPLLFCRGALIPADDQAIAIVGSRKCTSYGRRMTERIAGDLARTGWTIVSGLARGIDGIAHSAALKAGGRTIAVLAGGLSAIYPPEHLDLSREVEKAGCLITETPMKLEPLPGMFHSRNRIISGLARAVVVVEAGDRSGTLITAGHAAEQGREVFALPGNADSEASAGTLKLIRDGAKLIRSADDILEDLSMVAPIIETAAGEAAPPPPPPKLNETEQRVWDALADGQRHIDDLVRSLGMPVASLNGVLMMLEMKKAVRRLPGNLYERR